MKTLLCIIATFQMRSIGEDARAERPRRTSGQGVRPTSARVRTALFDLLASRGVAGARVLDLYAGLGTLGIEALRRGAEGCDFVEHNPRLCSALEASLEASGMKGVARVLCMKTGGALELLEGPYDVVFMDPPYDMPGVDAVMARLAAGTLVAAGGLLVVEHTKRVALEESYGELTRWRSRRYGDTMITIYARGET